jgi:hypothetical protein
MNSNLTNIEELLSIFDMKQYTSPKRNKKIMSDFIKGVIQYYENNFFTDYYIYINGSSIYASNVKHDEYTSFILSLTGIVTNSYGVTVVGGSYRTEINIENFQPFCNYNLISFNYDGIIEMITSKIEGRCKSIPHPIVNTEKIAGNTIRYCKLHGSIDKGTIIPPTWEKTMFPQVKKDWEDAFTLLKNANDIRIIGFSFPNTDSHISYLFKSAIIENENLKSIDVICMDNNNEIENKYRSIFCTNKFAFKNDNIGNYFGLLRKTFGRERVNYNNNILESVHNYYFGRT